MSFFTDLTLSGGRRSLLAVAALAALASPLALAQGKGEIRIAHVYSKTGPLEAYAKQTHAGLMMGLEYATGGKMMSAARWSSSRRTARPSPMSASPARRGLRRRRPTSPSGRPLPARAGDAAGRRGVQEDPAGRAGGRRLDHRRQVEPLHLPHRPTARRTRSNAKAVGKPATYRSRRSRRTTRSAATA